jgi:cellulose synthase/poly-beta-1,6-N-acetylglucosamine synthase-like glycosyltransferase
LFWCALVHPLPIGVPLHHSANPSQRRRQLGSERSTTPLPTVHDRPSDGKLIRGRLAIIITIVFWCVYVVDTVIREILNSELVGFRFATEAVTYLLIVTVLVFSALMYLVARQGALQRFRDHQRVPRAALDNHFAQHHAPMTVLVPSYSEEPAIVRATLWSAALQEYPTLRVVLLLDDPPHPADPAAARQLAESRGIAAEIREALAEPRARFAQALVLAELEFGASASAFVSADAVRSLASHYRWAARWLQHRGLTTPVTDHVETFFADQVLGGLADEFLLFADALDAAAWDETAPSSERMVELHRRLVWTFTAELDTFERKAFASLSHEANKAMNLNSYIGLMGRQFTRTEGPDGDILWPAASAAEANFSVPDAEYLLTLDADSLLLRDYCLRLVYFLEQSENSRVAVTQTPYSSFRGARTRIERLAGATTDVQHILHQGMSHHGAAFWVGANAVIRKRALDDIVELETVGGFEVRRYVQDRTVIEDTESSIDLGAHGWRIVNYPERLSYSATPPDFGSLIVQRRRWANGGLLILPKLVRQVRDRRRAGNPMPLMELALRLNYISSIAWASFGLVFLLAFPYDGRLLSPTVLLASLPYFLAMGSDLRYNGYRFGDILRIYGFNLILLPVNLAGVLKSLQQAVTGKKIPFARTPKVKNRTAATLLYVLLPYAIVAFSALTLWRDSLAGNWGNAAFAGFNAVLAMASIVANIGVWNSLVDIWLGLTNWLWVPAAPSAASPAPAAAAAVPTLDWRAVLYHGHTAHPLPVAGGPRPSDVMRVTGDASSGYPLAGAPASMAQSHTRTSVTEDNR